jgi:hypothetical protein
VMPLRFVAGSITITPRRCPRATIPVLCLRCVQSSYTSVLFPQHYFKPTFFFALCFQVSFWLVDQPRAMEYHSLVDGDICPYPD